MTVTSLSSTTKVFIRGLSGAGLFRFPFEEHDLVSCGGSKERNRSLGQALVTISFLAVADIRSRLCSEPGMSPSLKPTHLPFQLALLRATEFAQKLLIG